MTQPPEQPPTEHAPQGHPGQQGQPQQPPPPGQFAPPPQWPVAQPPAGQGYPTGGQGYPSAGQGYPPGGGYGAPSPYQQPSSGGSGKVIAIVIGVIVLLGLLVCGGAVGLIVWGANSVDDAFDEFDPSRVGGSDNPITVEIGEEFEIDGVEYAEGWSIVPPQDEYSGESIAGLKGTNDRDDESGEYASLNFTFVDGDDVEVGEISCNSDGDISYGNTEVLQCRGRVDIPDDYDHIEVAATY